MWTLKPIFWTYWRETLYLLVFLNWWPLGFFESQEWSHHWGQLIAALKSRFLILLLDAETEPCLMVVYPGTIDICKTIKFLFCINNKCKLHEVGTYLDGWGIAEGPVWFVRQEDQQEMRKERQHKDKSLSLRSLSKEFGFYPKWEGNQSLEDSVQRNGMACNTFKKMTLIILLEIFWGGSAEKWAESYCNNQGRADDTFNHGFCLDTVLSLLLLTPEVYWVQTWVGKVEVGHMPCALSLKMEPGAPMRICTHSLSTPVPKQVWH